MPEQISVLVFLGLGKILNIFELIEFSARRTNRVRSGDLVKSVFDLTHSGVLSMRTLYFCLEISKYAWYIKSNTPLNTPHGLLIPTPNVYIYIYIILSLLHYPTQI